jgi:5-methylcytosine-specific restriction endonuclease McrA
MTIKVSFQIIDEHISVKFKISKIKFNIKKNNNIDDTNNINEINNIDDTNNINEINNIDETNTIDENDITKLVIFISKNFTEIIPRKIISNYNIINWGNNGIGDRWANKKFNYTVIYKEKTKTYSENYYEKIPELLIKNFQENNNKNGIGIIGIFVHSLRKKIINRTIKKDILNQIKILNCVSCGSFTDIICDHKNDLYNDERVLNTDTQLLSDFQPLCNHCNLQKRQISKNEIKNCKIYSAKNIQKYKIFPFEFPWEKKCFNVNDINTKFDTYWYDPIEFNNKIFLYLTITYPIISEIKLKIKIIN